MKIENVLYRFFGNNLVIGAHIRRQLAFLEQVMPAEFQYRDMDDLGCGDGKVTLLLKHVFRPVSLRAYDINSGLVKRAGRLGINAGTLDLDRSVPGGDLAVLWGVLHHLKDFKGCLRRVKDNYRLVFIREPVRHGFDPLELGRPLHLRELVKLLSEHLPGSRLHYCNESVILFYAAPAMRESIAIAAGIASGSEKP